MPEQCRINGRNWKNWLQIKPSIIPGAGRGLFATQDISANTVLGKYHGRRIATLRGVHSLKDDRFVSEIALPNRRRLWIDGNVPSNYLKFVNGARGQAEQKLVNVEGYQYGGVLRFRAVRRIAAGEELILDYGEEYWESYSNIDGIKHRNDDVLQLLEMESERCKDSRVRAALRGMAWLIAQMASVPAYYAFFVDYLWMFYEFALSKRNPVIVDAATRVLRLELNGAQFRLRKIFKSNLADKWHFTRLVPMLYEFQQDSQEYAKFYRSYFPRSLKYFDASFDECMQFEDFEGMVDVLTDYCLLEIARHSNRYSRLFRLPRSRFAEYWRKIRRYDVRALEASVTSDDEQFDLDYQITHLIMCRYGYGSRVRASASGFDRELTAYLLRHERRILEGSDDLDLIAVVAYCYLELGTRKRWVQKAIDRILASQNVDGSWGTRDEMRLNMYDRLHRTWTAVTVLCHSLPG